MTGPSSLTSTSVRNRTRCGSMRVYLLSNSRTGPPRYMGRSDTDVQRRLLTQARENKYRYFSVEHKRRTTDA